MYTLLIILITTYIVSNTMLTIFAHYTYADKNEKLLIAIFGLPMFIYELYRKK